MWLDLILLVACSIIVGMKNPYLGVLTAVVGVFFFIQRIRTQNLLGISEGTISPKVKLKALTLAGVFGFLVLPMALEGNLTIETSLGNDHELLFPVIIMVTLFASMLTISMGIERKKR